MTERAFLGVWLPKEIYLHKGLTPTEKLLLAEVSSFSKNGVCFASNEHFSEFLGITKGHASKLITKLARMGFIEVNLIYKEGTKEVEKRTITPIRIEDDTPTLSGADPLIPDEHTPTLSGADPLLVDEYYKEQYKIQFKEQEKEQLKDKSINIRANSPEFDSTEKGYTKNGTPLKKPSSPQIEREFETLWKLYPRKLGKKKAFDSFKKARKVKKIPYETIENGLYKYLRYLKEQETEEQFIMHGSTWFNQEKWQDEYISTGMARKPKDALEYFRMKHGGDFNESSRNGEIIDYHPEDISELFQGL